MYLIGKIINTHGIRGEVKVKQITDFIERFSVGATIYAVDPAGEVTPLEVASFRQHKNHILLRFTGFSTLESVESFRGSDLKIKHEQLTELEADEYYYHEIIGCTVKTTEGEKIGKVDAILSPGANDVWVVKNTVGKEYLIPYIADVVKHVDVENKQVIIELMEGLLD